MLGFKFDPSQDVSLTARLILLTSGVLITFSGLALHLQKAKIWKPRYTYLFFIVNIVFITLIGYAGLHQETETKSCLFRSWGATKNDFRATIETVNLKKHSAKYELLLICRKVDLTQDQGEG